MTNKESRKDLIWEFKWNEKVLIDKVWNKAPEFSANKDFKEKLDNKLKDRITIAKEQKIDQEMLDSIPKKLKWRFYLTWYWYAVCSFLILFLIWFCTNIFTWTIKIPSKYNYLQQDEAFWNISDLWNLETLNRINSDFEPTNSEYSESKIRDLDQQTTKWTWTPKQKISSAENFLKSNSWINFSDVDIFLDDGFTYNKTYRFTYKDKNFPKLSNMYPVYKPNGVLMWSNSQDQFLKNLKIWDVSFWKFQDLVIKNFEISQNIKQGYSIIFDKDSQKLHFYPNDDRNTETYTGTLPSNKKIIRKVERNLKILWVSLKNYGDWEINIEDFDKNMWIIHIFYPFQIQWKSVRDPSKNEQIWINIAYDLNHEKILSIVWIDIATYDVSSYPTIEKNIIESEIIQWWSYFHQWALHNTSSVVLLDKLEIVYIKKILNNWEIVYLPAIKWPVSNSPGNYNGPSNIFEEIL